MPSGSARLLKTDFFVFGVLDHDDVAHLVANVCTTCESRREYGQAAFGKMVDRLVSRTVVSFRAMSEPWRVVQRVETHAVPM